MGGGGQYSFQKAPPMDPSVMRPTNMRSQPFDSVFQQNRQRMGDMPFDEYGLQQLLAAWGTDGGGPYPQGMDMNGDGIVDGADLAIFLAQRGFTGGM